MGSLADVDDAIFVCMKQRGFDLLEIDSDLWRTSPPETFSQAPYSAEWIELYGLGISTMDDMDYTSEGADAPGGSLKDGDSDDFYFALYGSGSSERGVDSESCSGEAWMQHRWAEVLLLKEYGNELDGIEASARTSPEVVKYDQEMTGCLRSMGYEFDSVFDVYAHVATRYEELGRESKSMETTEKMAALRSEEILLASAISDCGPLPWAVGSPYRTEVHRLEAQFLEENRATLGDLLGSD